MASEQEKAKYRVTMRRPLRAIGLEVPADEQELEALFRLYFGEPLSVAGAQGVELKTYVAGLLGSRVESMSDSRDYSGSWMRIVVSTVLVDTFHGKQWETKAFCAAGGRRKFFDFRFQTKHLAEARQGHAIIRHLIQQEGAAYLLSSIQSGGAAPEEYFRASRFGFVAAYSIPGEPGPFWMPYDSDGVMQDEAFYFNQPEQALEAVEDEAKRRQDKAIIDAADFKQDERVTYLCEHSRKTKAGRIARVGFDRVERRRYFLVEDIDGRKRRVWDIPESRIAGDEEGLYFRRPD